MGLTQIPDFYGLYPIFITFNRLPSSQITLISFFNVQIDKKLYCTFTLKKNRIPINLVLQNMERKLLHFSRGKRGICRSSCFEASFTY